MSLPLSEGIAETDTGPLVTVVTALWNSVGNENNNKNTKMVSVLMSGSEDTDVLFLSPNLVFYI